MTDDQKAKWAELREKYPLNKLQSMVVAQIRERFIQERAKGFFDKSGVYHEPVSLTEAEAIWTPGIPLFEQATFEPTVIAKLGLGKSEPISDAAIAAWQSAKLK